MEKPNLFPHLRLKNELLLLFQGMKEISFSLEKFFFFPIDDPQGTFPLNLLKLFFCKVFDLAGKKVCHD
jgi:hypothetical protein